MKNLFSSVLMTFSMFSAIPTPHVEWKNENMKYMLGALPLVGAVIGLFLYLWHELAKLLNLNDILFAAGMTVLPVLISGAIHLDGFCDTVDALSSHAQPERKREILKDPRVGAFAIIYAAVYFILYFALCTQAERSVETALLLGLHQMLSRSIGAFAGVAFPSSGKGLLFSFKDAATKESAVILILWTVVCAGAMIFISPISGVVSTFSSAGCLFHVRAMSKKEFGGMSGDIAGFLITLLQLLLLAVFIITEGVVTVCCL